MFDIPFTQYLRPDGRKDFGVMQVDSKDTYDKAMEVLKHFKGNFAMEVLMSGIVSMTFETDEEDMAIELSKNGPPVLNAITKLVQTMYDKIKEQTCG